MGISVSFISINTMLMITKRSNLLFFVIIINITSLSISQDIIFPNCDTATFTTNNTYQRNLDDALSSLTSNTTIRYGFYTRSVGQNPNQVNAIGLCRGDVQPDDCRACINNASKHLREECPDQKGAIGWYYKCMLRYSNVDILGVEADTSYIGRRYRNMADASNINQFNATLYQLLDQLRTEASRGGSLRKYASNTTDGRRFATISAFMQCTPDLPENQCKICLDAAMKLMVYAMREGEVYLPSCIIRYADYKFFENTLVLETTSSQPTPSSSPYSGKRSTNKAIIVVMSVGTIIIVILVVIFILVFKRRTRILGHHKLQKSGVVAAAEQSGGNCLWFAIFGYGDNNEKITIKTLKHSFGEIRDATYDFSPKIKRGEDGFGAFYKGKLRNGEVIAVRRLSTNSISSKAELEKEVLLRAKLLHYNLVRLLGFSLKGSELLLIYEFVENASLEQFLLDPKKLATLDWEKRYKIISGIAKGLLYVHEHQPRMLNHGDLKASNVWLDDQMNPKIAEFGIARLCITQKAKGNPSTSVTTSGDLSREIELQQKISVESDVFSFGVLLLEIITGQNDHSLEKEVMNKFLSEVWRSWKDKNSSVIIDKTLRNDSNSLDNMTKCIQIGLLCVQEDVSKRPTIDSVVHYLNSSTSSSEEPLEPVHYIRKSMNSQPSFNEPNISSTRVPQHSEIV